MRNGSGRYLHFKTLALQFTGISCDGDCLWQNQSRNLNICCFNVEGRHIEAKFVLKEIFFQTDFKIAAVFGLESVQWRFFRGIKRKGSKATRSKAFRIVKVQI